MSSKADPKQPTPTHYTSLQWIVGFGEAMFEGNMEWAKRNDPIFGDGSYRHIARLLTLMPAGRTNFISNYYLHEKYVDVRNIPV
jgi:hypothetical protein